MVQKLKEDGKKVENQEKKTSNFFFLMHFFSGGTYFINKKGLFYAKFFEFEEFLEPSFLGGSIQPEHTVRIARNLLETKENIKIKSHIFYHVICE